MTNQFMTLVNASTIAAIYSLYLIITPGCITVYYLLPLTNCHFAECIISGQLLLSLLFCPIYCIMHCIWSSITHSFGKSRKRLKALKSYFLFICSIRDTHLYFLYWKQRLKGNLIKLRRAILSLMVWKMTFLLVFPWQL